MTETLKVTVAVSEMEKKESNRDSNRDNDRNSNHCINRDSNTGLVKAYIRQRKMKRQK